MTPRMELAIARSVALVGAAAVVVAAGCSKDRGDEPTKSGTNATVGATTSGSATTATASRSKFPYGWYRGVLQLAGEHRVAFLFRLPAPGSADKPLMTNGEEEIEIKADWASDEVKINPDPDPYPSLITAHVTETQSLAGKWHRYNPMWGHLDIPFTADYLGEKNPALRFPPVAGPANAAAAPSFAGKWRLEMEIRGHAIGEFEQTPDGVVTGYIRPERFGDGQNLAGNVRNGKLLLSTFDGRSGATSIIAQLGPDGRIEGSLDIADKFVEKFTGKRDPEFVADHTISLKPGVKKLPLPRLDKAPYKDKPTIVVLFATWCPVCAEVNEAVLKLYDQHRSDGLQVLGVAIDLSDDEQENTRRLDLYRKKWAIPWETFEVPGSPEEFASIPPLSSIKNFEALPVTLFLNRDHSVRAMYAGFDGIATGPKHAAQLDEFKRQTEAIIKPR
jgi:thiol-disulfide isomerase/thioredoxin